MIQKSNLNVLLQWGYFTAKYLQSCMSNEYNTGATQKFQNNKEVIFKKQHPSYFLNIEINVGNIMLNLFQNILLGSMEATYKQ